MQETTDIKDQQAVIQAAYDKKEENGDEDEDEEEDDISQKYPEKEKVELEKAIADLTSQVNALTNGEGIKAAIEKGVDDRLSGMGLHRESNMSARLSTSPAISPLGAEGSVNLRKGEELDLIDRLADLDHSTLAKMREQVQSGDLDGLPREVVEAVSSGQIKV